MSKSDWDVEIALASLALALLLLVWGLISIWVQSRGHRETPMLRHARREVRRRGLTRFHPVVTITPDEGQALIEWVEEGRNRALLLSWRHKLDHPHTHPEETSRDR